MKTGALIALILAAFGMLLGLVQNVLYIFGIYNLTFLHILSVLTTLLQGLPIIILSLAILLRPEPQT